MRLNGLEQVFGEYLLNNSIFILTANIGCVNIALPMFRGVV